MANMSLKKHPMPSQDPIVRNKNFVEMALDYGRYCGLGQWRNGGYGRFVWKRIEDKEEAHE